MSIKTFWKSSTVNKLLIIFVALWILLAIVFGIYDLQISQFLFDQNNPLAKLVQNFGELPGILVGLFAIFVYFAGTKFKTKGREKLSLLAGVIISTGLLFYILKTIFEAVNFNFDFISIYSISVGLFFILVSLGIFYLFKKNFKIFSKKNYLFGKITFYTFVVAGIIVEVLKTVWGRIRYENVASGTASFTQWFIPQGITGGNSFPSGHAYLGWMLIPLILIFINKGKIQKWLAIIITSFFGLFISFERVVYGAHYASDVLFSFGIVTIIFLIIYKKHFRGKGINPSTKAPKNKIKNKAKDL